ncbi:germination protein, Ger(x)C family [Thermaerobacter marianensis DSM 12885]|uniref:Germination protein, Ger(X)C family n=1 Tax=Thermaerobacter marianensis (strain ATCC 700841 / DSM 12885 / JCM 10246 / 7p75a) TaxID=644966 RepID=E6SLW1_THEM7|nr:Ger(x)C family spore germination protein [Thermaerobacter marianensis]ADU51410.1 germination protein, Ger(x)C family [Thermaerobacter marianensis DSM 12885]
MRGAKGRALAVLLLAALLLTGCWDLEEIDRRTVVLGLAFDTARDGGWRMLATVPDPRALVPSGGTAIGPQPREPAFVVLETRGRTATENLARLRDITSRELFLGQVLVVGVSERLARQGVGSLLEFLMNDTDIPRAAWFVVGAGDPLRAMAVKPPQQTFPEFYLDDAFRARGKPAGALAVPYWRVWVTSLRPGQDVVVPVVEPGPRGQMRVARVAAFRNNHLVGILTERETWLLAVLRDARNTLWQVDLGGGRRIALRPLGVDTRIAALAPASTGAPRFRYDVTLNAALFEAHRMTGIRPEPYERAARRDLTRALEALIRRLQAMGSDPLGFGERWRIAHPRRFQAATWHRQWRDAQVEVRVRVNVTRGGAFR